MVRRKDCGKIKNQSLPLKGSPEAFEGCEEHEKIQGGREKVILEINATE